MKVDPTQAPTSYMPVLKGKPAEITAWGAASPQVRAHATPLFEVAPSRGLDRDVSNFVSRFTTQVTLGEVVGVDAGYVEQLDQVGSSGLGPDEWLAQQLGAIGAVVRPTVRVDDPDEVVAAVGRIAAINGAGVVLRLGSDETDPDAQDAAAALPRIAELAGLSTADLHLLIDLFEVSSSRDTSRAVPVANTILEWASSVGPWASVHVGAGAFPTSISNLPTHQPNYLTRHDAEAWTLLTVPAGLTVGYSDYAINNPALAQPGGRAPLPSLRYALTTEWLVWREPKRNPGNSGFFDVAAAVVASPGFRGESFSWGDAEVVRCASSSGSAGTAQQWRAFGTSHHLATVVDRLSNFGAP